MSSQQSLCRTTFHVKRSERQWDVDALYAYGLRLLSYRARSEREVRDRFRQHGATPEVIDGAVEQLRASGLLDDEAFAQAWVESRRRASPRGDRLLRYELAQKGVARDVAEAAVSPEADAVRLARAAADKKARALAGEAEPVFVRRLSSFLMRRGFDYDVVAEVVRGLLAERVAAPDMHA